MATLKYSRQRESIRQFIRNCKEHPTADQVYTQIKAEYPNISLGTVYRNLALLVELGEITKISTGNGPDRYDCNTEQHSHFICTQCHNIIDVEGEIVKEITNKSAENFDGKITGQRTTFYGTCKECIRKENEKK